MDKLNELKNYIKKLNKVMVAFSSGVDSTFLLKIARDTIGENACAITIKAPTIPKKELIEAKEFCNKNKIKHFILDFDPFKIEEFIENGKERCYFCKREIFKKIKEKAEIEGYSNILEGSNFDDIKDYRPGLRAVDELQILSPLKILEFSKNEIRNYSKILNLKTFNKPSFPCLASRIPYNEPINKEKILMVDRAENILYEMGFFQYRVRILGKTAKIEILPNDFQNLINKKDEILKSFFDIGFKDVLLDLKGYRQGSLNENIMN